MERTGNVVEGFLWIAIGVCFLLSLIRPGGRGVKTLALLTFVAFGLTDFVEMQTGAWWRPWWLLVWKGACIAVMVGLLVRYVRTSRAAAAESQ